MFFKNKFRPKVIMVYSTLGNKQDADEITRKQTSESGI